MSDAELVQGVRDLKEALDLKEAKILTYTNFTLRLRDLSDGHFEVEVVNSPVGRMRAPEVVRFNRAVVPFLEQLQNPRGEDRLTKDDLMEFGEAMGDMLLPPKVRRMFHKSLACARAEQQGLRLLLEVDDPLLGVLPWEYVYLWEYAYTRSQATDLMDGFLARDPIISIVRHESFVEMPERKERAPIKKLQIFIGMANPDEPKIWKKLDLRKEFREIKAALSSDEFKVKKYFIFVDDLIELKSVAPEEKSDLLTFAKMKELFEELLKDLKVDLQGLTFSKMENLEEEQEEEGLVTREREQAMLAEVLETLERDRTRPGSEKSKAADEEKTPPPTLEELETGLNDLKAEEQHLHLTLAKLRKACQDGVHIFHFSGHGGFFPEALVGKDCRLTPLQNGQASERVDAGGASFQGTLLNAGLGTGSRGAIVLEKGDDDPRHHILWSDELAAMLKNGDIRIVVLNACQSATRDPRNFVWTGVAPALLRAKVPAVVAMQFSISDDTAIVFAKSFYKVLSAGLPLDAAVAYGRRAIMDREEDERDQDWGVPVLYLRSEDGVMFPELATRNRRRKERNQYYNELFGEEYPALSDRLRKQSQRERGSVWLKELLAGVVAFFKRFFARIKNWFWRNG